MDAITTSASIAYGFAGFELNPRERAVSQAGAPVKLGARAFDVLMALIERRDRTVTKDELFDIVWPGLVVEESNLQVQVSTLRKLFGQGVIATIPGRGYRFVAPLDDRAGAPRARAVTPNNLPQQRTHFIGRAKELAQCSALLRDTRLLTLTGVGGCGKTRLALQLAQQQLDAFVDGVRFVDLAPLQDAAGVPGALAAVLDVREHVGTPLMERIVEHLAPRQELILLDNCEHVIDAVCDLCDTLLARCPGLKLVATSREGLGLPGEQLFSVQPLSLPAAHDLQSMDASEAVRMLVDRARLAMPDLVLDERNAPVVADICRRLDGIALALELAAARAAMLSFEAIRDRLDDRFRLLSGGRRALPRQQTLLATMQWSHDLLPAPEQRMFRQLAVFAGGCTLAAAAYVADATDEYEALQLLTRLHDKSLLQVDRDGEAPPRYRMLETVRQYAQERLHDAGEGDAARDRHLRFFVELAEQAERESNGPAEAAWMVQLRLEQENLLAAHAWAERAGDDSDLGLRLVAALRMYWMNSDQVACGLRLARSGVQRAGTGVGERARARALGVLSQFTFVLGGYEESARHAEASLALARSVGDTEQALRALRRSAAARMVLGEVDRSRPLFEQVCEMARAAGDQQELAAGLIGLGELHRTVGALPQAVACYEEAIELHRAAESAGGLANGLGNLARALVTLGQLERARIALLECMQTAERGGLRSICSCALDPIAGLAQALGDSERAARYFGTAEACHRETCTVREPVDAAFIAPLMAQARAELGPQRYASAEGAGLATSYDEAFVDAMHWLQRAVQ